MHQNSKFALFLSLILIFLRESSSQNYWPEIDSIVEEFRAVNEIPGLALVIVNTTNFAQPSLAKGYGVSDREMATEMDPSTRFLIASISKSFSAVTAVRILNREFPELGDKVLDIPIRELVPTFNLTLVDRYRTEKATFRDLMSHNTCLNSYGIGVTAGAYRDRADRLYRYRYIGEKCPFRSRFEYSNAMFILLGEIIGHLAKVPFENLVENLLHEIGMNGSLIVTPTEDYETLDKMSRGYYRNLQNQITKMNASVYNSHSGAAAGGVISTADDMGKYIQFHLNKGMVGGTQIVPEEVMSWLYEASNHKKFSGGDFGYGLGLDLGIFEGHSRIGHEGDLSPFTSRVEFYPDLGLGIFTAINGPGALPKGQDHLALHENIFQIIHGGQKRGFDKMEGDKPRVEPCFKGTQRERVKQNELVGVYGHPYEGDVEITSDGESLRLNYGIWGKGLLLETNVTNQYEISWEGNIVSIFLAYSGGPPLPTILWDFNTPGILHYVDAEGQIPYAKDGTIDTYPEIPWEEGSCGI